MPEELLDFVYETSPLELFKRVSWVWSSLNPSGKAAEAQLDLELHSQKVGDFL